MARKIHEELRRAVLDAWHHGKNWRSSLTRDALQDVASALGLPVGFNKKGGEIVARYEDGERESFAVPSGGIPLLWG